MIEYRQINNLPYDYIKAKVKEFLDEDLAFDDKTTLGTVEDTSFTTAIIESQSELVFAGKDIIKAIFEDCDSVEVLIEDGQKIASGTLIAKIYGKSQFILSRERVCLNLIQRLSGIATQSHKYAEKAKPYGVRILDTRKTTPGLRLFEKFAVRAGGAYNHRLNLSEGVLIKDNHLSAAGSIDAAVSQIRNLNQNLPIELEVDTIEQIYQGLQAGVDGFLLDNFDRNKTLEAVKIIRSYKNGNDIFIESSGGITYDSLEEYLSTGINAISIGALTHSVKAADLHMEFIEE